MALRNAFDGLATEGMLRRILQAVNFARDSNDRLIINMATGTIANIDSIDWGNNNAYPTYYGTGAANSVDMRDVLRQEMRANAIQARQHRWVIS